MKKSKKSKKIKIVDKDEQVLDEQIPKVSIRKFLFRHAVRDFLVDGALALIFLPSIIVYYNPDLRYLSKITDSSSTEEMFKVFIIPVFLAIVILDFIVQGIVLWYFIKDYKKLSDIDKASLWNKDIVAICVDRYFITRSMTIFWENFEKRIIFYQGKRVKQLPVVEFGMPEKVISAMHTMEEGKLLTKSMVDAVQSFGRKYYSNELTIAILSFLLQLRLLFVVPEIDLLFRFVVFILFIIWMFVKHRFFSAQWNSNNILLFIGWYGIVIFMLFFCPL